MAGGVDTDPSPFLGLQCLEQCVLHRRQSVNIYWIGLNKTLIFDQSSHHNASNIGYTIPFLTSQCFPSLSSVISSGTDMKSKAVHGTQIVGTFLKQLRKGSPLLYDCFMTWGLTASEWKRRERERENMSPDNIVPSPGSSQH